MSSKFLNDDELVRAAVGDAVAQDMRKVLFDKVPRCPWCRSTRISADVLETGEQASPLECEDCGAHQINTCGDPALLATATEDERGRGWWRGVEHRDSLDPPMPPAPPVVKCRNCRRDKEERDRQEKRFQRAEKDFQQAAKGMLDKHAQQDRVIITLRNELRTRNEVVDNNHRAIEAGLRAQLAQAEQRLTESKNELEAARKELTKLKGEVRTPEPEGASRFSLLDVD